MICRNQVMLLSMASEEGRSGGKVWLEFNHLKKKQQNNNGRSRNQERKSGRENAPLVTLQLSL